MTALPATAPPRAWGYRIPVLGWIAHDDIPSDGTLTEAMANPVSPQVNRRTTLKDALSMMLDADVQTGIVVDRTGAVQGLLTIDAVARKMRDGEHAAPFDLTAEHGAGDPDAAGLEALATEA